MAWAWTSWVSSTETSITLVVILESHRDIYDYGPIYISMNGQSSYNLNSRHWNGNKHWSSEYTFTGLSPGTTYYATMSIGGSPGDGGSYSTNRASVPTEPSFSQWSASGKRVSMYLRNTGTATSVNYYTSWNGSWSYYNSIETYPSWETPHYGGSYEIWVQGNNAAGTSQTKKAYAYSVPKTPEIWQESLSGNSVSIGIRTEGYFTNIAVDMFTATGTLYTTKYIYQTSDYYRTDYLSFGGLAAGATYTYRARAVLSGGYTSPESNTVTVVNRVAPEVPTMYHFSSSGKTITVAVGNDSNTTRLYFKPSWETYYTSYTPNQTYYTFEAPQYGAEYTIGVYAEGAGGTSREKLAYVMADPRVPSLSNLGIAGGKITLRVTSQGVYDQIRIDMYPSGSNTSYATRYVAWTGDTNLSTTVEFANLTPQASYNFRATVTKSATSYTYVRTLEGGNFPVTYTIQRPANWTWYTPKARNSEFNITAVEWNAFTTRINQFREFKALDNYAFTPAVSGQAFNFYQFNEARAAINAMATTGVGIVSRGDAVLADPLNILRNTLNVIT